MEGSSKRPLSCKGKLEARMQRSQDAKQINSTRRTRSNQIPALEFVRLDAIRKYFRKCRVYMQAYGEGKFGKADVKSAVHLYKYHRCFWKCLIVHCYCFVEKASLCFLYYY